MPAGRPSKYDSINLDKVKILVDKGFKDKEMADFFDVDETTWHRWKQANPEFRQSLIDWKVEADKEIERSLHQRAKGFTTRETKVVTKTDQDGNEYTDSVTTTTKDFAPDPTSMIFWLKNRMKNQWSDVKKIESNSLDALMDEVKNNSRGLPSEQQRTTKD